MKLSPEQLKAQSGQLFEGQQAMLSLWQSLADNFYPERADFTITRNVGTELADSLIDSYPLLVRRDLGNMLQSMLRDGQWFDLDVNHEPDHDGKEWLQWATMRQKRLIDDRGSNFVRATREGDHDYITFGQTVISVELNKQRSGLLFRNWHLRDCAWFEGDNGKVAGLHRKWCPPYHELKRIFGDRNHKNINEKASHKPFAKADIRHIVMPSDMYGDETIRFPFVSIFIDMENEHIIEETGLQYMPYVVPRFQTISGSPYAYSPATVIALPDARLIQAMTHTLLEAGERYTRPPILATQKAVRSDIDLSADGITWVDKEYDERFGAAMRPLIQNMGGFPIGMELRAEVRETLSSAFFLDKLSLPDVGHEMTAYEVSERMKQFRREALPLFAPIEAEYSGQICELAFDLAMSAGLLGSVDDIPESLQGSDVVFKFKSPLSASEEEEKVQRFMQTREMLASAMEFDPNVTASVDIDTALRDAITGSGAPLNWLRSEDDALAIREQMAQAQALQQAAQLAQ